MNNTIFCVICLGCLIGCTSSVEFCKRDKSTLKQLVVLFRHGDRNPEGTFPTDKYQEDSWPLGWGQLTPRGVLRHFQYGQWMRSCYGSFFNETLSTQLVYVRSTDIDRTLMSAQAHITGIYPPKGYQQWGQNVNISLGRMWQPFPVHTVPIREDSLMQANKNCVRYNEAVEDAYNSSQVVALEEHDADILRFLGEKSGLNTTDLYTITKVMSDPVIIEMQNNRTLVPWLNKTLTDKLVEYFALWFDLTYVPPEMAKLAGGPLLGAIVDNMVNRSKAGTPNAPPSYEHVIYSGHDTTVASILASLGGYNNIPPPYTATVIFELHETDQGAFGVLVYYRNSSDSDPFPVKVANCSGFMETGCLLADFVKATSSKISRTHATDCLSGRTVPTAPLDIKTILIVVGVTVGLMIITITVALLLKYLRRRPADQLLIDDPGVN